MCIKEEGESEDRRRKIIGQRALRSIDIYIFCIVYLVTVLGLYFCPKSHGSTLVIFKAKEVECRSSKPLAGKMDLAQYNLLGVHYAVH